MLTTKDPLEFLARLTPHVRRLRALAIPGEHAFIPAAEAAAAARAAGIADADAAPGIKAALDALIEATDRPHRVLICGSLYLAGAILAENG
jgi:dihydrofolate synthase/folylpolyglutamate synthase